jgi:hypothetical protein
MDPLAADACERILKHIFQSPRRRYKLRRRNCVSQGFVTSVGYLKAEWYDAAEGLRFSVVPHDRLLPCPGFQDIHDPACSYTIEVADLTIKDIQSRAASIDNPEGWINTEDLWCDSQGKFKSSDEFARRPASPAPDENYGEPTVRVLFCRERRSAVTESVPVDSRVLAPNEQYMRCPTCGNKEMGQPDASGSLPAEGGPCPTCLERRPPEVNYMRRIAVERTDAQVLKYPNGRLRIVAPYQKRLFFDGDRGDKLRSYEFLQWRPYEHPTEHIGQNDVALHATKQAILDSLTRFGYEQMRASKRVFIVAGGSDGQGLLNSSNRPFRLTDADGHFAYTKSMNVEGAIKEFQGAGIPSGLPTLYNLVYQSLQSTLGFRDFGLTSDRSKDIAAASLEKIEQVGEIPVEDHRDTLNDEESIFKGVCLDLWISRATPELALKALGPGEPDLGIPSGPELLLMLRQMDVNDMDVVITASPDIRRMNRDQMNMIVEWMNLYAQNPAAAEVVAQQANIPPSILRKIDRIKQRDQAAQQAQAQIQAQGQQLQIPPSMNGNGGQPPDAMAGAGPAIPGASMQG